MGRLTEKDVCGNWSLKGLPWKRICMRTPLHKETYEIFIWGAHKFDLRRNRFDAEEIEKTMTLRRARLGKCLNV